ncbi:uncharacterized protein [Miscanthus floridulus]|uniref:uncharacterized protein n=1 Tax=Miscanthus floridulus TaxID=154761 RepID=UPI00345A2C9F
MWLTITDPDAEQPPVDTPRIYVQVHHEPPTGLKHALSYKVFPHLVVVEDLSFINGDGGQGGHPNRKRRREFLLRYGEPDSLGEAWGRHGRDRGRQEHRNHRRDEDHDGRGGNNRRHRRVSAWGRVTRFRNGVADCYSTNFRGPAPRGGGSYRSRLWEEPRRFMYKKKVAPAPTTTKASKNMKHVSFAEPLVSFLGESIKVASEHGKKATKTADQELLKERKSGDILVQDKGAMASTDPLQDLLFSQHLDQPLTKKSMEALQVLVEHGAKKMKKGGNPRKQGPATRMEMA